MHSDNHPIGGHDYYGMEELVTEGVMWLRVAASAMLSISYHLACVVVT